MFENARLVENGTILEIHIPMKFKRRSGRKEIILPPGSENQEANAPTPLQLALARAYKWQKMLDEGEARSARELARRLGLDPALVGRTIRLTMLAPDIVEAILEGNEPEGLTLHSLRGPLPLLWEEQRRMLGFE